MRTLLKLMDIKTLVAGVFPVLLGSIYSLYRFNSLSIGDMLVLILGILLMQSSANMINDIYDHKRGSDDEAKADEKAIASGEIKASQVRKIAITFILIDIIINLYYSITLHWGIFFIGVYGALIMYCYSAGKKPISYTPFGEVAAGSTMGICIMSTVIYIQSGIVNFETILVTLPTSIYIGSILLTNNIADHQEDKKAGRYTLPLFIGISLAERLWQLCCYSLLIASGVFVYVGYWPLESLVLAVLLFPYKKVGKFKHIEKKSKNKDKMMAMIGIIGIRYHLALVIGFLIAISV